MRILLIAYEYPPVVAAQSLRWFYLVNELAEMGAEIHVVCPTFTVLPSFPPIGQRNVVEHRVWPGPFIGLSQWLVRKKSPQPADNVSLQNRLPTLTRIYLAIRFLLNRVLYPDLRTEWYPFARWRLKKLFKKYAFDALVSSHEPGVDLMLGLWAKRRYGVRWIADLADPLCAPYSPAWRRKLDKKFEGFVIRRADRVVITTEQLRGVLLERHSVPDGSKIVCIPQGVPEGFDFSPTVKLAEGRMNIVFTGNFYEKFRSPERFAAALKSLNTSDVSFTIAGNNERFKPMFEGVDNVNFLGQLGHFDCLSLQKAADALLNLGNVQTYQIPGKVYEYLGSAKPILHIRMSAEDPSEKLLVETGLGIVVDNEEAAILGALTGLLEKWRLGELSQAYHVEQESITKHTWRARARQFLSLVEEQSQAMDRQEVTRMAADSGHAR